MMCPPIARPSPSRSPSPLRAATPRNAATVPRTFEPFGRHATIHVPTRVPDDALTAKEYPMAAAGVVEFTDSNFDNEVIKSSVPVLVDFWAEWCQPCRMLTPTIEAIA